MDELADPRLNRGIAKVPTLASGRIFRCEVKAPTGLKSMVARLLTHARLRKDLAHIGPLSLVHLQRALHDEFDSDVVGLVELPVEFTVWHVIGIALINEFAGTQAPNLASLDIGLARTSSRCGDQSVRSNEGSGEYAGADVVPPEVSFLDVFSIQSRSWMTGQAACWYV